MYILQALAEHWKELLVVAMGFIVLYYLSKGIRLFERRRHENGYDMKSFWNYYRSSWGGQPFLTSALTPKVYIFSKLLAIYIFDFLRRSGLHDSYIPESIATGWLVLYILHMTLKAKVNPPKINWRPADLLHQIRTPDSLT